MPRPTDYKPNLHEKVAEYVEKKTLEDELPTVEGVALYIGVHKDTIYEWLNYKDKEGNPYENIDLFSDSIKKLLARQAELLQIKGLTQKYNPTMSIFLLKVNHGMNETSKVDITSGGEKLPSPILNIKPDVHTDYGNTQDNGSEAEN